MFECYTFAPGNGTTRILVAGVSEEHAHKVAREYCGLPADAAGTQEGDAICYRGPEIDRSERLHLSQGMTAYEPGTVAFVRAVEDECSGTGSRVEFVHGHIAVCTPRP